MKKLLLILTLLSFNAYSLSIPEQSKFDKHISYVNYNPSDVTEIKAKNGYVSVLIFAEGEETKDIAVGFATGWDVVNSGQNVYIRPKGIKQTGDYVIDPIAGEWDTNLFIRTNLKNYSFDLKLVDQLNKNNAYSITFKYPEDEEKQKILNEQRLVEYRQNLKEKEQLEQQKIKKEFENGKINAALNDFTTPKNWDYFMKVGKNTNSIIPSFAYDDGVRTYIGFNTSASVPAVFYYKGKQEIMSNVSVKQQGIYTVIVVHNTANRFILRSGKEVVGIINNGYGKNINSQIKTTSDKVIRQIK